MILDNVNLMWTKRIKDPQKKEEFIKTLKASRTLIDRFTEILDELEDEIIRDQNTVSRYDNPAWAYRQAYHNGCTAQLRKIKDLFKL
jgi:hypothetical protein